MAARVTADGVENHEWIVVKLTRIDRDANKFVLISIPFNACGSRVIYIDRSRFYGSCAAVVYFCAPVNPLVYYASTLFFPFY